MYNNEHKKLIENFDGYVYIKSEKLNNNCYIHYNHPERYLPVKIELSDLVKSVKKNKNQLAPIRTKEEIVEIVRNKFINKKQYSIKKIDYNKRSSECIVHYDDNSGITYTVSLQTLIYKNWEPETAKPRKTLNMHIEYAKKKLHELGHEFIKFNSDKIDKKTYVIYKHSSRILPCEIQYYELRRCADKLIPHLTIDEIKAKVEHEASIQNVIITDIIECINLSYSKIKYKLPENNDIGGEVQYISMIKDGFSFRHKNNIKTDNFYYNYGVEFCKKNGLVFIKVIEYNKKMTKYHFKMLNGEDWKPTYSSLVHSGSLCKGGYQNNNAARVYVNNDHCGEADNAGKTMQKKFNNRLTVRNNSFYKNYGIKNFWKNELLILFNNKNGGKLATELEKIIHTTALCGRPHGRTGYYEKGDGCTETFNNIHRPKVNEAIKKFLAEHEGEYIIERDINGIFGEVIL